MNILEKSYELLYKKPLEIHSEVLYSGKIKLYSGRILYNKNEIILKLNSELRNLDEDIVIGLIHLLLNKVFKTKNDSYNINLYYNFLRNINDYKEEKISDPLLKELYNYLNLEYFQGDLREVKINYGLDNSNRVLGYYDMNENKIVLHRKLKKNIKQLKEVLFHEMLHKKLKFERKGSSLHFHNTEFKKQEQDFLDKEKKINNPIENRLKNSYKKSIFMEDLNEIEEKKIVKNQTLNKFFNIFR